MNKQMFLDGLRSALSSLPPDEIEKTLAYYGEIIDDRIEEGMSEEEAVASMEPIEVLAARVIDEAPPMNKAVRKAKTSGISTVWLVILAILGFPIWFPLLIALCSAAIAIFAALLVVMIALIAVVVGLAVGGIFAVTTGLFASWATGPYILLIIGSGMLLVGIAILLFFPVMYLIKGIWAGLVALARKIRSWFRR
jgi:uncharacterized membrane protein